MYSLEVKSLTGLALLYSFRMLGLFMVLPVLALYADDYQGATPFLIGLALGVYGIGQSLLQIPFGMLSDRWGRKPIIVVGMLLFFFGSLVAASATTIEGVIFGRLLQGAGAVASTIMAMLSDLTSEEFRVKAMATVGASIGLSFALAMVVGPWVASIGGMKLIFLFSAGLALTGVFIVIFLVPTPAVSRVVSSRETLAVPALLWETFRNGELFRLNVGIFVLHLVLMACWVSVPVLLETQFSLALNQHWWFYLTTMGAGFVLMLPFVILAEKRRRMKPVFITAIVALIVAEVLLIRSESVFWVFIVGLVLFFTAFNLLEASLPSLVSKAAPSGSRGTAMGIYSSSQFLGAFVGGVAGGWLSYHYSLQAVFAFSLLACVVWLLVAVSMPKPKFWSSVVLELLPEETIDQQAMLQQVPGLADIVVIPDHNLAYLKVDKKSFDRSYLNAYLGR